MAFVFLCLLCSAWYSRPCVHPRCCACTPCVACLSLVPTSAVVAFFTLAFCSLGSFIYMLKPDVLKNQPPLNLDPTLLFSCNPASPLSLGATPPPRVACTPISPPSSVQAALGSPSLSTHQAVLTVVASVLHAANCVDSFGTSLLPETPGSVGLIGTRVSWLPSHFSGHFPSVVYLALSANVPQSSLPTALCFSIHRLVLSYHLHPMPSKSLSVAQPFLLASGPT